MTSEEFDMIEVRLKAIIELIDEAMACLRKSEKELNAETHLTIAVTAAQTALLWLESSMKDGCKVIDV